MIEESKQKELSELDIDLTIAFRSSKSDDKVLRALLKVLLEPLVNSTQELDILFVEEKQTLVQNQKTLRTLVHSLHIR